MPSRILSYLKIVKGESRTKQNYLFFYAKPHPILSKDSERREQNKTNPFVFYAKPHPILFKDSERPYSFQKKYRPIFPLLAIISYLRINLSYYTQTDTS